VVVSMQPTVRMRNVWTIEDVQALDVEDWWRYEIVDGALVVSPSAAGDHELASEEVRAAIRAALPAGFAIVGPMGVEIGRSYRIPDLLVTERARLRRGVDRLHPSDIVLVVEVVSPGSVTTDRITKPAQYAAAGIGSFWRVETDPVSLTAYTLAPGASTYTELGQWRAGELARISDPFPVQLDLTTFAPVG
jgi:Uma2 family endonuclease